MSTFSQLLKIWRDGDLESAIGLLKYCKKKSDEEKEIAEKMRSLGLIPDTRIGAAIQIANKYGITFDVGTTRYDCRAILPRSKWENQIDRNASLETLAFFTIPQSYDEIEDFQGISDRIEIAICQCLIQARIAGVL